MYLSRGWVRKLYLWWTVPVKISIVVGKECIVISFTVNICVSAVIESHKGFLLKRLSYIFNWVSAPDLTFLDNSSWRNYWIWSYDASFLEDSAFHDNWVVTYINSFFYVTWIKSAIILNYSVSFNCKVSCESSGWWGCGMQDTIVSYTYILNETALRNSYLTLLISPLITVPCQIAI